MIEVILSVGLAFLATVIKNHISFNIRKMKQIRSNNIRRGPSYKAKVELNNGWTCVPCMISISSLIVGAKDDTSLRLIKVLFWLSSEQLPLDDFY